MSVGTTNGSLFQTNLAANGVLYSDANGVVNSTSVGTAGQVLTSNGSGVAPTFQPGGGGGGGGGGNLVLIQSQTASNSATIDFTTGLGTYNNLFLVYSDVTCSMSGPLLSMLFSVDGGSTYLGSGYQAGINLNAYNSASVTNVPNTAYFYIGGGDFSSLAGSLYIYDMLSGAQTSILGTTGINNISTGDFFYEQIFGTQSTTGVNGIRLQMEVGNILTGTFTLYGISTSGSGGTKPGFQAGLTGDMGNATGDGTTVQVIFNGTTFDNLSNFNTGTGAFTAPVSGQYLFTTHIGMGNLLTTENVLITINNTSFSPNILYTIGLSGTCVVGGTCILNMNSGDTAAVDVTVSGGTKNVGIQGDPHNTAFYGYLL